MTYECNIDLTTALDWQRSNAEKLKSFIAAKQLWYQNNHCDFWNDWVVDVFNLATANEFGLSVWAVILDEPVFGFTERSPIDYPAFGFNDPDDENFFDGSFGVNSDVGYEFTTEQIRSILQLKAYILHMSGSTRDTNAALKRIFGESQLVCLDGLDMTLTYLIQNEDIVSFIREIKSRDLLPRPAAVGVKLVNNANVESWGFGGEFENFNNGNFYDGEI